MTSILIIDDDRYMCALLQNLLLEKGYSVTIAFNGIEGIAKATAAKFDIVLCDFVLPDMQGDVVLTRIKKLDSSTIVIVITGYPNKQTAVDVIKLGAYDYILKPIVPENLIAVMEKALSETINHDATTGKS
ncbi:MAG TPA: response regulator [Puia sp.]|nr:response regulator [Puia sp.]